jgi:hypothetical protein
MGRENAVVRMGTLLGLLSNGPLGSNKVSNRFRKFRLVDAASVKVCK